MPTLALAMIVKNEAHCIKRCLDSVLPYIDYWVVCDTGSTDATREVVWETLGHLRGELAEDEWTDFAYNRNKAQQRAARSGCDYILVIDADEFLVVTDPEWKNSLKDPWYTIASNYENNLFVSQRIFRADVPFVWKSKIHEYAEAEGVTAALLLEGVYFGTGGDGARSQSPDKHERDIALLRGYLEEEPDNARYQFYLAATLGAAGQDEAAIEAWKRRCHMQPTKHAEVFFAHYQAGLLYLKGGKGEEGMRRLRVAYGLDPRRAEPIYWLGMQYFANAAFGGALPYFMLAAHMDEPLDLFIETSVYEYKAMAMLARTLAALKHFPDARQMAKLALEAAEIDPGTRKQMEDVLTPDLWE